LGCFASEELNDKLALISLLALVTYQVKKKNTEVTPLKILMDITKQKPDDSVYYQMLEALSIITEDFMYGCSKFDSFGLKTSSEIIQKIKEILSTWTPF